MKVIIIHNCAACPYTEGDISWEDAIYCNHWKRGEQVMIEKLTDSGRKDRVLPDCPLQDYVTLGGEPEIKIVDFSQPECPCQDMKPRQVVQVDCDARCIKCGEIPKATRTMTAHIEG